jgi:hypothetical protein
MLRIPAIQYAAPATGADRTANQLSEGIQICCVLRSNYHEHCKLQVRTLRCLCQLQNNSETAASTGGNATHGTSPDLCIHKDNKNYINNYRKLSLQYKAKFRIYHFNFFSIYMFNKNCIKISQRGRLRTHLAVDGLNVAGSQHRGTLRTDASNESAPTPARSLGLHVGNSNYQTVSYSRFIRERDADRLHVHLGAILGSDPHHHPLTIILSAYNDRLLASPSFLAAVTLGLSDYACRLNLLGAVLFVLAFARAAVRKVA